MKSLSQILILLSILLFSSCGKWLISDINSRGVEPDLKKYYITSSDTTITKTLEFKEYASFLKDRLNELGYEESQPNDAAIAIIFDYNFGEKYLSSTTVTSSQYNIVNSTTSTKSSTNANANFKTNTDHNGVGAKVSGNTSTNKYTKTNNYSIGYTDTDEVNNYSIPLNVTITAVDNNTKEPYWEVLISHNLSRKGELQTRMPWLILGALPYFGKGSRGEVCIEFKRTENIKEKYNLTMPY